MTDTARKHYTEKIFTPGQKCVHQAIALLCNIVLVILVLGALIILTS